LARPEQYPWKKWLDGGSWTIRKGRDFTIETESMRRQIKRKAREAGLRADTYLDYFRGAEQVNFQIVPKDAPRRLKIKRRTGIPTIDKVAAHRLQTIAKRKGVEPGAVVETAINLWWDQLGYSDFD
jgi:hypothetical protein